MGECEICGNRESQFIVFIEGAKLTACGACARGGKILASLTHEEVAIQTSRQSPIEEEEIIENYGKLIKNAREQKGISVRDLARKLNEAENFLDHIEKGKLRPTIKVAKKLEKELGIKIVEKTKQETSTAISKVPASKDATLFEFLEHEKKKN